MLGKIEGRRRRGHQRMRWLNGITDAMDMNLGKLWEMVKDRKSWHAVVHGVAKSWTWLGDWTTTTKQDAWLTQENVVTIRLSLLFQAQDCAHAVCLLTKGVHEVKTFDRFVISVVISSYIYNAKKSFLFFCILKKSKCFWFCFYCSRSSKVAPRPVTPTYSLQPN